MSSEDSRNAVWRPHVTVACIVQERDQFLMVEENVRGRILFNQPAGHLEPGESLPDAACRETLEETGWEVELQAFIGARQYLSREHGEQVLRFTFAARPLRHRADRVLDEGILGAHWMDYAQIAGSAARLRSPLVLACLDDWLAGSRWPLSLVDGAPSMPGAG
ncbi:MAG: NUDIX hydrolase [Proteobacteria bacterium]|nr:NUDIX hydrolase [Pseudomonadota bacterium]